MRVEFECHPNVFRILDKPFSTREISAIIQAAIIEEHVEEWARQEPNNGTE
jgi:hypothetical protein